MPLNVSTYIFGRLSSGYTQFPDDQTTRTIFENAGSSIKTETQLYIHRSSSLIYYCYLRKLADNRYFGLCVVFNGIYITDLTKVFAIFEEVVDYCATYGYLIRPNIEQPYILEPNSSKLYLSKDEVERISNRLTLEFSSLNCIENLSPIDYATGENSVFEYDYVNADETLSRFASAKPHTFIYKSEGYITDRAQGFIGSISRLNLEKESLKQDYNNLNQRYNSLQRKQKNYYWIWGFSILSVIFLAYLWNTVLFPSNVTNKDMGEYNYYGEMRNGMPHGKGVAFFKEKDPDGRAFYVGCFSDGRRKDNNGSIYYKNGDMFRGKIFGNSISEGVLLKMSDSSYYIGTFYGNGNVKTGTWYDIRKAYNVKNGK